MGYGLWAGVDPVSRCWPTGSPTCSVRRQPPPARAQRARSALGDRPANWPPPARLGPRSALAPLGPLVFRFRNLWWRYHPLPYVECVISPPQVSLARWFVHSQGLYANPGAQGRDGYGTNDRGDCAGGLRARKLTMVSVMAGSARYGVRSCSCGPSHVCAEPSRSTCDWEMDRIAERVCKSCRCRGTCFVWISDWSDREICNTICDYCRSVGSR